MKIEETLFVAMVGMYGESGASFWWSRFYGAIHRLIYHFVLQDSWGLVYVDDSL